MKKYNVTVNGVTYEVLVEEARTILLAEHDRIKPKSVALHKEKDIIARFKKAFEEYGFTEAKLCEVLSAATGKEYEVDYVAERKGDAYHIVLHVLERDEFRPSDTFAPTPVKTIYAKAVDPELEVYTMDLSDVKGYLRDMYKVEDMILEDFESLEKISPKMFTHILKALESKYFEIKKSESKPVKR